MRHRCQNGLIGVGDYVVIRKTHGFGHGKVTGFSQASSLWGHAWKATIEGYDKPNNWGFCCLAKKFNSDEEIIQFIMEQ
jgi:hypothetical protein